VAGPATYTGGDGPVTTTNANSSGTPLLVNGVLYMTEPNAMFAIDARTGRELWHYQWNGVPLKRSAIAVPEFMATGSTSRLRTAISFHST